MYLQGRIIIVWLSWLIGGICGVLVLLIIICYCRLMPRHQKPFGQCVCCDRSQLTEHTINDVLLPDEKYLKDGTVKDSQVYASQDSYRIKHTEVQVQTQHRHERPVSCAGAVEARGGGSSGAGGGGGGGAWRAHGSGQGESAQYGQYASSTMLDEVEEASGLEAMKTRSLPAFLRPKPRPLSTEDDLQQLYAKVNLSKKYKNRMRSSHAAVIALSKSRSQALHADAVLVYDQRTQL